VKRILKILSLVIGLAALMPLAVFGFAIWVFMPALCIGIVVAFATIPATWKQAKSAVETEYRKAA
jgi:hypothetical protein